MMLKEIALIFGCLALGKIVNIALGLPVPGSVWGMLLLFAFLKMRWIKEDQIKSISEFLLKNMAFFFVPAGVGILLYLDLIRSELIPIIGASLLSTLVVLWIVGVVSGGRKR